MSKTLSEKNDLDNEIGFYKMKLCEDDQLKIYFILFGLGGLIYIFSMFKAYKHSKNRGYKPTFPMGPWSDFSLFLKECSINYKKHNDKKLKRYYVLLNLGFALAVVSTLYFAFI